MIRPALCAVAFAATVFGGCGCQALTGPSPESAYLASDRATFNAIGPEYSGYIAADPKLTPDQKARRNRTLSVWRLRIEAALRDNSTAAQPPAAPPTVQPIP